FSTAGVGKSSLLGMIARNSTADVNVVALVGERGREVLDFIEDSLGEEGLKRSVVVVSTSDQPPLRRIMAAYTATAIAEYFRDQGKRVMLLMDSVTRFARALREIALSVGEPPARQGYPPSVFAALPELLERAGITERGSITGFYTTLLSTEQIEDPLGEEIRAILDGHLVLSSRLSRVQHYPAIDILQSNSRLMQAVVTPEHGAAAEDMRRLWAIYEEHRDLISIGAYKPGSDPSVDEAIEKREAIARFLVQPQDEPAAFDETVQLLRRAID
ncbi:MAG: FliI/YscN family ATPase, partial [Bdellovibrionales bacterium]|nr:FliI/YscN family ATPase [Bdellovibrionales bacterium]